MSGREKANWNQKVTAAINKFFNIVKSVIDIIYKIIRQIMSTIVFFFQIVARLLTDPNTACLLASAWVILFLGIAGFQWWQIGIWFGRVLGVSDVFGWGVATVGVFAGLALNIEQLSPEIWKIWKNLAKAFQKMKVNPQYETSKNDINDKLNNWESYDYQHAKKGRWISYAIETGIVLAYIAYNSFTVTNIVIALISLICPEWSIKNLAAKTSVYSRATEIAIELDEEDDTRPFSGGGQAKGGGGKPDFTAQPGRSQQL